MSPSSRKLGIVVGGLAGIIGALTASIAVNSSGTTSNGSLVGIGGALVVLLMAMGIAIGLMWRSVPPRR